MASEGTEHRLAAVLMADVVGYSRLMAEDEPAGSPVTLIVPGAIRTNISADALRGDGTFYGRVERLGLRDAGLVRRKPTRYGKPD